MLEKNYKNIIYFISITILVTIVAQVYWNYKNFELNKQQIHNQIKTSFDDSIEMYYTEIAKNDVFERIHSNLNIRNSNSGWINSSSQRINMLIDASRDSINKNLPSTISYYSSVDTIPFKLLDFNSKSKLDSLYIRRIDSSEVNELTTKIILSFQEDVVDLKKVDSLFNLELERKNLVINHGFNFEHSSHFSYKKETKSYNLDNLKAGYLTTNSNSSFLPPNTILELRYENPTSQVFKKIFGSILLSFLLSGIIIGCLLFLFKTIARQKQLSEIKNDLISNITHEFKTPIATIGVALESIKDFKAIDDVSKTNRYIYMSSNQLFKLNTMVEKLLETASLDSKDLDLKLENVNLVDLINSIVEKHKLHTTKRLEFKATNSLISSKIDVFHFENAINNIVDNAIKYGGDTIEVLLNLEGKNIQISISDNGTSLNKDQKQKIFDKFYRVPKGNTHDVKGFGIGLYYTKKIIEKHQGTIELNLDNKLTTFKIILQHE